MGDMAVGRCYNGRSCYEEGELRERVKLETVIDVCGKSHFLDVVSEISDLVPCKGEFFCFDSETGPTGEAFYIMFDPNATIGELKKRLRALIRTISRWQEIHERDLSIRCLCCGFFYNDYVILGTIKPEFRENLVVIIEDEVSRPVPEVRSTLPASRAYKRNCKSGNCCERCLFSVLSRLCCRCSSADDDETRIIDG